MDTHTIFFIGKPGCGKGTQAKLLSQKTGWAVIGSGKEFREIATLDTPVGRKVREENYQGLLQPHWFAMYLYLKNLFALPEGASAIFDGFNRKEDEARLVVDSLLWLSRPFKVILIDITDEEAKRRVIERREKENREDDNFLDTRLEEYEHYTKKAIELFEKQGALVTINGERTREEIAEDIARVLNLS